MYKTYFNTKEVEKYDTLINLFLSDRSDGKTFDIKASCFKRYKNNKTQTIYLRRWKSELTVDMYETFFNEVIEKVLSGEFVGDEEVKDILNYEFLGTKRGVYIRLKGSEKWDLICYFMPLTMTTKKKSTLDVSRITHIEYDEFVPVDNRYCKNEMHILMEFFKSVDRDRDTTKLNLYGNRIDNFNPFFDFFDIHIGIQKERVKLYKDNTIAIQIYINKEHREERSKSKFSSLIKGTSYEEYNSGGVLYKNTVKISNINGCNYFASFKSCIGCGSIFINSKKIVISSKIRKDGYLLVDKIYNTGRDELLINFGNIPKLIKDYALQGQIFYDCENTFHNFEPLLNKIGGIK